ncbi:hypothetical protein MAUB_54060 [Mycolicibacterium aubagnense]|uniref:Transposase n=1 Tax=Mycolicibacterium aubagnense TaxID=319707 RepID=A0ABM7ILF2_9MYCO|nr:hypothetical protein MAUB_54060 [Mycolicibacterium aubagnense]
MPSDGPRSSFGTRAQLESLPPQQVRNTCQPPLKWANRIAEIRYSYARNWAWLLEIGGYWVYRVH